MPPAAARPHPARRRDAAASQTAILDSAEEVFAQRGFDRSSLHEIAGRAGVSTALPAYFFGGKEGLYRAVIARLLAKRETRLAPLADQAAAKLEATGDLRCALELLIDGYIAFLVEHRALVSLMAREALDGGRRLGPQPRHSLAVQEGLARLRRTLPPRPGPAVDPEQLVISTVALCFFPLEHADTMLAAMGLDATADSFVEARRHHVVDLLLRVLTG